MSDATEASSDSVSRALTRQSTADLPFFTPSAISFNPKPYMPNASQHNPATRSKAPSTALSHRETSAGISHGQKPADVSYSDPEVTFIRYPFTDFPDAHLYPEGLSYNAMAENSEWFLDPVDFKTDTEMGPDRIPYPQILEPPRGWCPIRKKGAGSDEKAMNVNDDDAPKLRCTFCRRSYAGVNAKSMWRRHVLEKHKIPMSNRRDGNETVGRGRSSSNKENKRTMTVPSQAPTSSPNASLKAPPKLKSSVSSNALLPTVSSLNEAKQGKRRETDVPLEPAFGETKESAEEFNNASADSRSKSAEPDFAPSNDYGHLVQHSPVVKGPALPPSSPLDDGIQSSWRPVGATGSPTRTPGLYGRKSHFRMPWKFPSPSHPLYSSPDELCLAVPVSGMTGEGLRSSYVAVQASPFPSNGGLQSQFSSPGAASPLSSKQVIGKVLGWKRTKSKSKSKLPPLPEPSPRRPLYSGPLPVPNDSLGVPDLTFSTDTDSSFSMFGDVFGTDSFTSWFDMNSPLKSRGLGSNAEFFPDTPIRRTSSASILDQLQLAKSKGDEQELDEPESAILPKELGLGFKFDLRASGSPSQGSKRPREDDQLYYEAGLKRKSASSASASGNTDVPAQAHASSSKVDFSNSQFIDEDEGVTNAPVAKSLSVDAGATKVRTVSDVDSDDQDLEISDLLPLKRRRLFD